MFGNANNFSGLFFVSESLAFGDVALFITGGGVMTLVAQVGTLYTTTAGTGSKVNVYLTANVIQIQNNSGSSCKFNIVSLRARNSQ